jgi:YggT family protein
MLSGLLNLLHLILWVYRLVIVVRALLPWFGVAYYHPIMAFLIRVTEPVLQPIRRVIPPYGGIDFSPLVALFLLWVVEELLTTILLSVF